MDCSRAVRVVVDFRGTAPCAVCGGPVTQEDFDRQAVIASVGRVRTVAHAWHFYDDHGREAWDYAKNTRRFARAIAKNEDLG